MSFEITVSIRDLGKCYRIFDKPQDRLKQSVCARLYRAAQPLASAFAGRSLVSPTYFQEFWALRDVSLEIRRGETLGIIGLNGSGKSTLLQIIAGTLAQTEGEVSVNGRVAALLELGSGFNPEFTGRENIYINGAILGCSRDQIDSRFEAIEKFADIGGFIDQPVKTYSSGMYVRLAFAVIAHVDADVLLIDEALSVGDVVFSQKCMRFLRDFQNRGTIIFVSHDTGAVLNLCDRALWLQQGSPVMVADGKTVCEAYLESLYARLQGPSSVGRRMADLPEPVSTERLVDQRRRFLNYSSFRNDIELFAFDPEGASFGKGGARIVRVDLSDSEGRALAWAVGGEEVILRVQVAAHQDILSPIVGFYVKDRLGQFLFGDNTYLTYRNSPISLRAGDRIEAKFAFTMPVLPVGEYSIAAAVAEGTQHEHVQHHWLHDAVQFKSHSSSISTGLVGIPMWTIQMHLLAVE